MANEEVVPVLAVSPFDDDHSSLEQILVRSRWIVNTCRTCKDAFAILKRRSIPVIICEESLPDGSWKDVLEHTQQDANPPQLIVAARLPDERLWCEVLNLGGYDLLSKPFRQSEVCRGVTLAFVYWQNHQKPAPERYQIIRAG
jgi:DNA-binding response OmpR family regulator